jgi:hypothetical protein
MATDHASRKGRTRKQKRPLEAVDGLYFALPHSVLDSDAWRACSPPARALLLDLCRQHNGANNGHLHLTREWLAVREWKRPLTVQKLRDELLHHRLIVQTRTGGLNAGPHLYALSWLDVANFKGLEISEQTYHKGAYLLPVQPAKKNARPRTPHVQAKALTRTPHVPETAPPRTPHVPVKGVFRDPPRTPHVHNECVPLSPAKRAGADSPALMAAGSTLTTGRPE